MTSTRQKQLTSLDRITDHALGPADAEVTVLEYGDFTSVACAEAQPCLALLRREFGDEIRVAFRHFPERAIHPLAEMAAEASEAMAAQGKFWPYHDLLFSHHAHLSATSIRADAEQLEADMRRFDAALLGHAYLQRVQEQMESARLLSIRAMPTFYVNGVLVDVSFGLHHLTEAVEWALRALDDRAARRYAQPPPKDSAVKPSTDKPSAAGRPAVSRQAFRRSADT